MSVEDAKKSIAEEIKSNKVVLYMKGNKMAPQCGFSGQLTHILNLCNAEFVDRDVLQDEDLRQGIKDFSDWPTIPQLYVNGEFIGGCDVVTALYQSGELQTLLSS